MGEDEEDWLAPGAQVIVYQSERDEGNLMWMSYEYTVDSVNPVGIYVSAGEWHDFIPWLSVGMIRLRKPSTAEGGA